MAWPASSQGTLGDWPAGCYVRPHSATCEEGPQILPPGTPSTPAVPHSGSLSPLQAPERPLVGVNGLDVTSLRPFDLVIPFTIKKGEITGEWEREGARELQARLCQWAALTPALLPYRGGADALRQGGTASHH